MPELTLTPLESLTLDRWAACQGSRFTVHLGPGASLDVELVSVTKLHPPPAGARGARQEPFALQFRGPRTPVLPQRIYRLEQQELGTFDLFLVPVGPDPDGMRYEAIFN